MFLVMMSTDITTEPDHAVTFAGEEMFFLDSKYLSGMKISFWVTNDENLPASAGSYDIVATTSISAYIKLIAIDITGARQDAFPKSRTSSTYATSLSYGYVAEHPGDFVFHGFANSSSAGTWSNLSANYTTAASLTGGSGHTAIGRYRVLTYAGNETLQATNSQIGNMVLVAMSIEPHSGAPILHIDGNADPYQSGSSSIVLGHGPVEVGDVVIASGYTVSGQTMTGVTDSQGNTYSLAIAGMSNRMKVMYTVIQTVAESFDVSINFSSEDALNRASSCVVRGLDPNSPFDVASICTGTSTGTTATDGAVSGYITPSHNNSLIVGFIRLITSGTSYPGTNFSQSSQDSGWMTEYIFQEAAAQIRAAWTNSTTNSYYWIITTWKPASTGPTNVDITPGRGAVGIAGITPNLSVGGVTNTNITPQVGALSVAGRAGSIGEPTSIGKEITPGVGSLSVSGREPIPRQDLIFNPNLTASRRPLYLVKMRMGYCSRTFGASPCLATGEECYNTFPTCKYRSAFLDAGREYKFTSADVAAPFDGVRPYIKSVRLLPTEIKNTLTVSGRVQIEFYDEPDNDVGIDPYVTGRSGFPRIGGTFWKKFIARNRNYARRIVSIYEGWTGDAEAAYKLRWAGRISNGKYDKGVFKVEGEDFLKDLAKIDVPPKLDIKVNGAMTDSQTSILLNSAAGLDTSGTIRIDDEVITYSGINVLTLTGCVRARYGTVAVEHSDKAKVQKCRYYPYDSPVDLMIIMLRDDAEIPVEFIDFTSMAYWKIYPREPVFLGALITEPTKLSTLFFEIVDLMNMKVWYSEENMITCCRDMPSDVARTWAILTDADNIVMKSAKVDLNESARLSRAFIYWEKSPVGKQDEVMSYGRLDLAVDADAESDSDYGEVKEKKFFSRWLSVGSQVEEAVSQHAKNFVMRQVWRNRDAPMILSVEVALKDEGLKTGQYVKVTCSEVIDLYGNTIQGAEFQIIRRERKGDTIALNLLRVGPKPIAFIAPNNAPDWASATDEDKKYGYICANDGILPSDLPGYHIY
jgi:hypothetical protein